MNGKNLLNRTATREYILESCKRIRSGWRFTRVCEKTIDALEQELADRIDDLVIDHISRFRLTSNLVKF
jgi:hypothetical protein